jgi:hypothetical protein
VHRPCAPPNTSFDTASNTRPIRMPRIIASSALRDGSNKTDLWPCTLGQERAACSVAKSWRHDHRHHDVALLHHRPHLVERRRRCRQTRVRLDTSDDRFRDRAERLDTIARAIGQADELQ